MSFSLAGEATLDGWWSRGVDEDEIFVDTT